MKPRHPPATIPPRAMDEGMTREPHPDPSRSVYLEVFGCQMNKLDGEVVLEALLGAGYAVTGEPRRAGVILFNTCAVRKHAEDRAFSRVGALRSRKRRDPGLVVGVLGCLAQRDRDAIFRRFPFVDIVCGTREFTRLPGMIDEVRRERHPVLAADPRAEVAYKRRRNLGRTPFQAYLSVMRGCSEVCSFCVVPYVRGPESSRPLGEIVEEARVLAAEGVSEITLLGQTVNSYRDGDGAGLHTVLESIDRLPGISRLRFVSNHPRYMTDDLVRAMASLDSVCEHLHLPIQSGSDAVLARMKRSYTADEYRRAIDWCRRAMPDLTFSTDFIVGFPGETDNDFQATVAIHREIGFQSAFIFKYSERPGTAAARLEDDVPQAVKEERNRILLEVQQEISLAWYRGFAGRDVEVLVEGPSRTDPSRLTGRTRANQIVVFPGSPADGLRGRTVRVRVDDATHLTLYGRRV